MLCLRSSAAELARALHIINQLLQHPLSAVFAKPVDARAVGAPDYYTIIKSPQDLGTIKGRLESNYYLTISQWHSDVALIWSNCLTFNGPDAFISQAATELARKFDRLYDQTFSCGVGDWIRRASYLFDEIDDLVAHPPGSVKKEFSGQPNLPKLAPRDLIQFAEAVTLLSGTDDVLNLLHMTEMYGVDVVTKRNEAHVDMTKLSQPVLHRLVDYAKERCRQLGLKYPT
jgi:hypothetical protein